MMSNLHKISREEAETIIDSQDVISTKIEQNSYEVRVRFGLTGRRSLLVIYDLPHHQETFFLDELLNTLPNSDQ